MEEKTRPCEICGVLIDAERVEWQPETRLCTKHAQAIVKFGGEFKVTFKETDLSKAGSLKRNPGDVVVDSQERNMTALDKLRSRIP